MGRKLNSVTELGTQWPIPKVTDIITRLTQAKATVFAKFDLTSGYWQVLLEQSSRPYTAFTTKKGMYQWVRLPMGLKGAPSYFQRGMVREVLHGLVYNILEVYLDDILIYA